MTSRTPIAMITPAIASPLPVAPAHAAAMANTLRPMAAPMAIAIVAMIRPGVVAWSRSRRRR